MDAGAIILAGGKSSRMGTNKALLKMNDVPAIERISKSLKPIFLEQMVVTNEPDTYQFLGVKTVKDQFPGRGPLAGIHAGLLASPHEVNLITACDMPFVSAELARALVLCIADFDAVVPVINGREQPLFSVFKKKAVTEIETSILKGRLRVKDLLGELNVLYIDDLHVPIDGSAERIFFNMNHPHEYEEAKKWAEEECPDEGRFL